MVQKNRNPEGTMQQLRYLSRAKAEFLHLQGRLPKELMPCKDVLTDNLVRSIEGVAPPLYVDKGREAPFNRGVGDAEIIRRLDIDPVTKKGGRIADNASKARIELEKYEEVLNSESPSLANNIPTDLEIKKCNRWNRILNVGRKVGAVAAVVATGVLSYMAARYGIKEAGVNDLYVALTTVIAAIAARAVSRVKIAEPKRPVQGAEEVRKALSEVKMSLNELN